MRRSGSDGITRWLRVPPASHQSVGSQSETTKVHASTRGASQSSGRSLLGSARAVSLRWLVAYEGSLVGSQDTLPSCLERSRALCWWRRSRRTPRHSETLSSCSSRQQTTPAIDCRRKARTCSAPLCALEDLLARLGNTRASPAKLAQLQNSTRARSHAARPSRWPPSRCTRSWSSNAASTSLWTCSPRL